MSTGARNRIAFAVFADNGNIRCFSSRRDHPSLKALEAEGCEVVTLTQQGEPIAVAAMENDHYVITGIEDRCLKALQQSKGPRGTALIELYPGAPAGLDNQQREAVQ
jgi:hypothetical protein